MTFTSKFYIFKNFWKSYSFMIFYYQNLLHSNSVLSIEPNIILASLNLILQIFRTWTNIIPTVQVKEKISDWNPRMWNVFSTISYLTIAGCSDFIPAPANTFILSAEIVFPVLIKHRHYPESMPLVSFFLVFVFINTHVFRICLYEFLIYISFHGRARGCIFVFQILLYKQLKWPPVFILQTHSIKM